MNPKPGQTNMEFYIFNRSGTCLYSSDLVSKQVNSSDKEAVNKQKLLFGLMWSLKGFS